jgi:hypothetical protein
MRLSRVPVLSLCQHDLVFDPGGLRPLSPVVTGRILRSSSLRLSALPIPKDQASWVWYPLRDHDFQTTFEAPYRSC